MIICGIDAAPPSDEGYYDQLYYYFPTMMCLDLMNNYNRINNINYYVGFGFYEEFLRFLISITILL